MHYIEHAIEKQDMSFTVTPVAGEDRPINRLAKTSHDRQDIVVQTKQKLLLTHLIMPTTYLLFKYDIICSRTRVIKSLTNNTG